MKDVFLGIAIFYILCHIFIAIILPFLKKKK